MKNNLFKVYNLILIVILFFNSCNFIGAGSYAQAEYYPLKISEEELIEKIKAFKSEYPQYKVIEIQTDGTEKEIKDGYLDNFYRHYFYLDKYNLVVHCVIGRSSDNSAGIGFYAISDINFDNIKRINTSGLTKSENKEVKKAFKKEVLTPLKEFISNQE